MSQGPFTSARGGTKVGRDLMTVFPGAHLGSQQVIGLALL